VEVLVALAVVAIAIVAIASVMSINARGVRALESHVALIQSTQTVLATAIPPRKELAPGTLSGQLHDYHCRSISAPSVAAGSSIVQTFPGFRSW